MGTSSISLSIFSVLLFTILWTPAYTDKCSITCKGSSPAKSFQDGHTYKYTVDGTVSVYLAGTDKQDTSVKVFGQVSVSAVGNCAMALKVNSLAMSGPDGKKHPAPKGIEKVVMFSYEDGRVGPEICAEEDDHRASLNIKRSIISLLQTEQKPSTQIDVFGACPTEVSSSHEGSSVLLHRSRDLSRCAHREQTRSELVTAVYNPTAEIKNTQILRSVLNVEAKLNNWIPEKVSAVEEYLYRPFAIGENGARAQVNTKLTLSGTSAGGATGACPVSRSIIFENPHDGHVQGDHSAHVLSAVKETCKVLGNGATPKSAGLFAQLVRIMRSASKGDLMKVFGQVKDNNLEKRVFLDGLLRAGTGASIEASILILKSKVLSPMEQNLVFLSLGSAKHVTNEAIKAATGLLDLPDVPKGVYLGVGGLAGIYCRDHNCHTEKNDGITALSKKFAAKLQNCKPKTKPDEDVVVAVLKGIRNIRHLDDVLIDKLVHCAMDNGVKARVKVNALEAFLADPCSSKIKKASLDIMKNRQLDSEIRIKAYLAVIACPCGKSANEIKNLLETEPVHQVGRFITSSLRHIRSSSNPDKQHARQHYGLIGIPKKFNIDDRKYSFYREMSFNVDILGVGGDIDQTVIYSQDSFLPRSASLNLTTELFGHSVNLLEVGGRQGNLDRVIEHFLGPKGYFRTKKPQEIYDELVDKVDESYQKVEGSMRGRRSANMDKQIKFESNSFNNELDLDMYVKLFGTDAVFLSLGDDKGFDYNSFLDQALKYVSSGLDQMKRFQHDIRSHILFLDAELAYPTSTGLPLKLDFVGSATGRLDISSSIDVRQILRNPENTKVDIKLVPSTNVEVSLMMLVDAYSFTTGIKVSNNLHSSTGSHVIAKVIENGQGFDLQWGMPVDKQEILTASNDLVFFTAEKGQQEKHIPIKVTSEQKEYSACFDQLAGVIGLNLCGEASLPFTVSGPNAQESISKFFAKYPLVGSSRVRLVLEKNDLRGYHLKGVLRSDKNQGRYGIELLFDAEGSRNRRTQITGDLVYNPEEFTIKYNIELPFKSVISNQLSLYAKPNEYTALVIFKFYEVYYYFKAGLMVNGNERRSVMKPVIEFIVKQNPSDDEVKQNIKVDGQVIREINGPVSKYTIQGVKLAIPNAKDVIHVDGHFGKDPKGIEMDIKLKQGQQNMLLSGSLKGHDVKIEFQNTINPYANFKVNGHFENAEEINHNDIELYYGGDLRSAENCVILNQLFKRSYKSNNEFNVISKNKFEIRALPAKAQVDFEVDPKKFDLSVEGNYIDRKALFGIVARTHIKKPGDYHIKTNIVLDKQAIEALAKRDVLSNEKSNFENYIDFKDVSRYELSGVVLHKTKSNDVNVGVVGHLKVSGSSKDILEDIKFDIGGIDNSNMFSTHATISSKSSQLVDFLLKLNRGANANGQLKLILHNTVEANGKFQITDKDGKGNGNIMINFNKLQRVIKGESKFVIKDPVYNAEVDLFMNFDKDNNDKIHFSTSNKKTDKLVDSKNKLQYAGKTTEVNIHHDGIVAFVSKMHTNIEIVLPTERCLALKMNRELTEKDNVYNGFIDMELSDAEKRGAPASYIKMQNKVADTNLENNKLNYEGQVEFKLKDGKNLVSTYKYKNTPNGEKCDLDVKTELSGSMMPKKAVLEFNGVYDLDLLNSDDTFRGKVSYGDDLSAEFVNTEVVKLPEKGEQKLVSDFTVSLRLPLEKAHDLKWSSKIIYVHPEDQAIEVTLMESVQVNADLYKFESSGKYGEKEGSTKLKAIVPHVEPVILDLDYKVDRHGEKSSGNVDLKAQYGKGKVSNLNLQGSFSPQENQFKFISNSPQYEDLKVLSFTYIAKNPTPDSYSVHAVVDADGRVYKVETMFVVSKSQPLFDLKYFSPSKPQGARIYLKGSDIRSNHGQLELKIENCHMGYDMDADVEVDFDKDIDMKLKANWQKLGVKNYKMTIHSKDAGSGKRLEFSATNDNKNVLSGSTSFISKQEGPKMIIEGSGTLKIKNDQKPANFKYIRTFLTEGDEQGVETFVNVAVGDRNHVAETRITNLEYKGSYVYCEEKKQCAHAEIHSKISINRPVIQQTFNLGLDLRKLGFPTEFGLQSNSEYSDKKFPQHELNLHVNKENEKIHLHAYSKPEFGKFPAGITITLPQRVLAAESLVQFPVDKGLPFPIKAEFNLYPDKNKPQSKTSGRLNIDIDNQGTEHGEVSAVVGFSHPRLGKEALAKFRGGYKRPDQNSIKIESSALVSHSVFGHDREAKFSLESSPTHIKLVIDTPIVKVIDLEGSSVVKENLQQGDLKFSLLQGKPVRVYAVAKDFKYYELSTSYSDEADRKLSFVAHLDPEKRIDVSADIVIPGQKRNIINGALYLEDNQLKTQYGASSDTYQYFLKALKKDISALEKRVNELQDKSSSEFKNVLKRVQPTFQAISQTYQDDVTKIMHEITNDTTLAEISEALQSLVKVLATIINDATQALKPLADKLVEGITDACNKIHDMYEKQIEPQIKELYGYICHIMNSYLDGLLDLAAHFGALVMDFVERHKPELQELTNMFTEIFSDLTRILVRQLREWRAKSAEFFANITEQIKELPFIAMIKEKWQELAVPEQLLGLMSEGVQTVRGLLPTEECRVFLDTLFNYAQKKVHMEKVDEMAELVNVYEKMIAAVNSLTLLVRSQLDAYGVPTYPVFNMASFVGGSPLSMPSFGGSASFNLITQILRGDIPDPLALFNAYRPRSLNPLDEVPSKLRAVVVNGQHIFTFDGSHLTFPGSCRYVLAQDHVDKNFTLMIQLANGNPKALILEDKSGTIIELKENGQVTLNGAAHGYPVMEKDVFAFRQAKGHIGLGSVYGMMAFCTSKLEVCYIEVSGFYLGKLRGLLGDGNNEPFDDFRMPNGKITHSESEFGHAYRRTTSCPQPKTPEHSHMQHHMALPPACEKVFGGLSPLRPLSLFLDMAPFRQACIHACSGDDEEAIHQACDLARGYAALALSGLLPAAIPSECVRCTDCDKPRAVGDIYEYKLPQKQADIVVSVELTKSNEMHYKHIMVPLIGQVIDSLKAKRITDVKVYLVGATSKFPYPVLYDTDLKLTKPKVTFDDESRYDFFEPIKTKSEYVNRVQHVIVQIINELRRELGLYNVMAAYQSIAQLPLRPGAVKHLISTIGDGCESVNPLTESIGLLPFKTWAENNAITVSTILNTDGMKMSGGKPVNQVVGFSKNSVLMVGDKKGKGTEGLRANLVIPEYNECMGFIEFNDGVVFSASNFMESSPQHKPFLQTMATSITSRMLQDALIQECTCTYVDPFRVRSICVNKERKEVARRRK